MEYAATYLEHVQTGKLCLSIIPDAYKWSFCEVWKRVDQHLRHNLDLDHDEVGVNRKRYVRIMRMIFETTHYDKLIRNVYHAKLIYQEELGPVIVDGSLEWLSLPNLVLDTSPFKSDYCPCCNRKRQG